MKHLLLLSLALCVLSTWGQSVPGWSLVWNDEFDGTSIDPNKWQHEQDCWGGGNGELQCYTKRPENSRVENGNLIITARQEKYTGTQAGCTSANGCTDTKDYTSARLRTRHLDTGSWKYGRFELKAKLPKGKHLWPAFWMLPTDNVYGAWAGSGEVDIMEYRGQVTNSVQSTLFHGAPWPNQQSTTPGMKSFPFEFSADFHVFVFEWELDEMRFYVDSTLTWSVNLNKMWGSYTAPRQPWDQRFHMIINLAIGGNFFNGMPGLTAAEAAAWTQPTYTIDYVRVYKKGDSLPAGFCGDDACNNGETSATCPLDCPPSTTTGSPATTGPAIGSTSTTGYTQPATTGAPATTGPAILPIDGTSGNNCGSKSENVGDGQSSDEPVSPQVQAMQENIDNQLQLVMAIVIGGVVAGVLLMAIAVVMLFIILKRQKNERGSWF